MVANMELKQQRFEEASTKIGLINRARAFFEKLTPNELLLLAPLQGVLLLFAFFTGSDAKGIFPYTLLIGFIVCYFFRSHALLLLLALVGLSKMLDMWVYSIGFFQASLQYLSLGMVFYCFLQCLAEQKSKQERSQQSLKEELEQKIQELQALMEKQFSEKKAFSLEREELKQNIAKLQSEVEMLSQLVKVADADAKAYFHEVEGLKKSISTYEDRLSQTQETAKENQNLKEALRLQRDQLNDMRVQLFQARFLIQWKNFALNQNIPSPETTTLPKKEKEIGEETNKSSKQDNIQEDPLPRKQPTPINAEDNTVEKEEKTSLPDKIEVSDAQEEGLQGQLKQREQEKTILKKQYYELLDHISQLKAKFQKDPADVELKKSLQQKMEELKQQKNQLVQAEKDLFSLKKDLRDQGLLFSS